MQVKRGTREANRVNLLFSIRDTGIGIDPSLFQSIFEAFVQADGSLNRKYGGTGLGLAIASRLVQQLGGELHVESKSGVGSTFSFEAWFATHHGQESCPTIADQDQLGQTQVLVVDDNATNLSILQELFTQWGTRCTAVNDGRQALEIIETRSHGLDRIDLLVSDVQMPVLDGYSLCKEIWQRYGAQAPKMLLLTSGDRYDRSECVSCGISECLVKPLDASSLLHSVLVVLGCVESSTSASTTLSPELHTSARRLRILVAEDSQINRMVISQFLEMWGHDIVLVNDGQEAVDAYSREMFDLVLMDVQMPRLDGFEATNAIREMEAKTGRHIPIVALTAHAIRGYQEHCLAAGMDAYVSKPFHQSELFAVIERLAPGATAPCDRTPEQTGGSKLNRYFGDDAEFLAEVIDIMLGSTPQRLNEIEQAIKSADRNAMRNAVHLFKSEISNFGKSSAFEAAARLEQCAAQAEHDELWNAFEELKAESGALLTHLKNERMQL